MNIPQIVKDYVLKHMGRMPETQDEIDLYLDLINYAKEYEKSLAIKNLVGVVFMKRLGFETPEEVKRKGDKLFKP